MANYRILITGAAGFIGSHVARLFCKQHPNYNIVAFDKLTYAGNLENLADLIELPNFSFEQGDICDPTVVYDVFTKHQINAVIHLAAESHVDRSIEDPLLFVKTNVLGTAVLLQQAKQSWFQSDVKGLEQHAKPLFYHVSTDEVYGSLGADGLFTENTPYDPRSPYSASKAASDHLVRAYYHTYQLPVVLSNCSNNYGPNQYPEKLIPVVIKKIIQSQPIPVYGSGINVRDWLYVTDHAQAIHQIFHKGVLGKTYNIGGNNEWNNLQLVEKICDLMDGFLQREPGSNRKFISFVTDRKGHDLRYAIDAGKLKNDLGWEPRQDFDTMLSETILWYIEKFK